MVLGQKERHGLEMMEAACLEASLESGWGSEADRRWLIEYANERRRRLGIPPLDPKDDDYPPELGFYERARALGMFPRGRGST